ncbi:uncharacterized protein LOC135200593 [Macrobrachium nipponense]|uniref:uncharacterized protein LOC135200593 n=1 Tax=Macrobrachium nipponense TaxID=159736 RepID=UPI0030C7DAC4
MKVTLIAFLLVISTCTSPLEIPGGCFVMEEISEKFLMDSMEFLAFCCSESGREMKIFLMCNEGSEVVLQISSSEVQVSSSRNKSWDFSEKFKYESSGWQRLLLHLYSYITLKVGKNELIVPPSMTLGCEIKEVRIRNGKFTRMCPKGTPSWRVEGSRGVEVPLIRKLGGKNEQLLALFSLMPVNPVIRIQGEEISLGKDLKGLLKIILTTENETGKTELLIETVPHPMTKTFTKLPSMMNVAGKRLEKFLLMLNMTDEDNRAHNRSADCGKTTRVNHIHNNANPDIQIYVASITLVLIVFSLCLMIHHLRRMSEATVLIR